MDRKRTGLSVVVDTNVIAYYLLGTPEFVDEVRELCMHVAELQAPALWEAELANVLWMAVRSGALEREEALAKLDFSHRLAIRSIATQSLWRGALVRAIHSGVAVYDTLFVELAEREQVPLITFDAKLLKVYPSVAMRPNNLIA